MRIIIVGCGKIGRSILKSLVSEGHEIVVLDNDPTVIAGICDRYDVMGICASGTSCEALSDADVRSAGLFVAATGNDEVNMLSCYFAGSMGAKHTAARIGDPQHTGESLEFMKNILGISMVFDPKFLTAQAIYNILKYPSAVRSETFTRRRFEMAELTVKPNTPLDGAVLFELRQRLGIPFLICCVLRDRKAYIPNGNFVLREGDRIGLLAAPSEMHRVLKSMELLQKSAKNVMILGGNRSAAYLAKELSRAGYTVKIIERDPERCVKLSSELPSSVNVVCGDGTMHSLLTEEGLDSTDAFISLTGMDEENILASYYAHDRGVPKTVTKVNQEGFGDIGEKLELDCIVSPRRITADAVTGYARALQNSMGSKVETLYSLMNGSIEALEFTVAPDFRHLNTQLRYLKIRPGILLAGIIRGSGTIIPGGNDVILPGDNVIVVSADKKLHDLSDIML